MGKIEPLGRFKGLSRIQVKYTLPPFVGGEGEIINSNKVQNPSNNFFGILFKNKF